MNKPYWNDAPDWANYMSMDENGNWWWFEFEPFVNANFNEWQATKGRFIKYKDNNWIKTLEERPCKT